MLCYPINFMKAFSNSVLAVLIVAALFWGNCFSCPQLLLSLAQKAPHGCCKRSAPVKQTCTTSVLKNFVKADPVAVAVPLAVPERVAAFALEAPVHAPLVVPREQHSPPDLIELT